MNEIESRVFPDVKLFGPVEIFSSPELGILEDSFYKEGTVTWGYGIVGGAEIEVTKGASVNLNIDFEVTTIAGDEFTNWKNESNSFVSDAERSILDERWGGSGYAGGLFGGFFGVVMGGGDAYHYKDQQNSSFKASSENQEGFLQKIYNIETRKYKVSGNVTIVGQSNIPSKARIFVQTFKVQFSNGKEITVIDTQNPVAASQQGDTSKFSTAPGQLTIVPLS